MVTQGVYLYNEHGDAAVNETAQCRKDVSQKNLPDLLKDEACFNIYYKINQYEGPVSGLLDIQCDSDCTNDWFGYLDQVS